jgi:hypothetical protein
MKTSVQIDITSTQLHKFIQSYRVAHPQIEEPGSLVDSAISARWPEANPLEIVYQAAVNQAREDFDRIAREAARKTEEWIDTTVQGDLFSALPQVRIPKWLTDREGARIPYYKASPDDVIAFLEARRVGLRAEIVALEQTLEGKQAQYGIIESELGKHLKIRELARQNGLDLKSVRYARQGE